MASLRSFYVVFLFIFTSYFQHCALCIPYFHQGHIHSKARSNYRNIQRLQYYTLDTYDGSSSSEALPDEQGKKNNKMIIKKEERAGSTSKIMKVLYAALVLCGSLHTSGNGGYNIQEGILDQNVGIPNNDYLSRGGYHVLGIPNPNEQFRLGQALRDATAQMNKPFTFVSDKYKTSKAKLKEKTKTSIKATIFKSLNPIIENVLDRATDGIVKSIEDYKNKNHEKWKKWDNSLISISNIGDAAMKWMEDNIPLSVQSVWNKAKAEGSKKNNVKFKRYEQSLVRDIIRGHQEMSGKIKPIESAKMWFNKKIVGAQIKVLRMDKVREKIRKEGKKAIEKESKKNVDKLFKYFNVGVDYLSEEAKPLLDKAVKSVVSQNEYLEIVEPIVKYYKDLGIDYAEYVVKYELDWTHKKVDTLIEYLTMKYGDWVIEKVEELYIKGKELRVCDL